MRHTDTAWWHGELLAQTILKRNEVIHTVHNSMADADDPTVGISMHGQEIRIPLPDFTVSSPGATLFTKQLNPKTYYIEVKTKTYFGFFENWDMVTTGFNNWNLELYHRLSEEHGWEIKVWFIQVFNRCEARNKSWIHQHAIAGIYEANIGDLYYSRPACRFNEMSFWPVFNGPLSLINTRHELEQASDTGPIVSKLIEISLRDATIAPNPAARL
jgi:hypothetical protein